FQAFAVRSRRSSRLGSLRRIGAWASMAQSRERSKGDSVSFVLEVKIRIKPDQVDNFMAKLAENAKGARSEPGCKTFDVSVDPNDKTSVMLYEVYTDEKAFQVHQETPHFKKYLAEAIPLLASRERKF